MCCLIVLLIVVVRFYFSGRSHTTHTGLPSFGRIRGGRWITGAYGGGRRMLGTEPTKGRVHSTSLFMRNPKRDYFGGTGFGVYLYGVVHHAYGTAEAYYERLSGQSRRFFYIILDNTRVGSIGRAC